MGEVSVQGERTWAFLVYGGIGKDPQKEVYFPGTGHAGSDAILGAPELIYVSLDKLDGLDEINRRKNPIEYVELRSKAITIHQLPLPDPFNYAYPRHSHKAIRSGDRQVLITGGSLQRMEIGENAECHLG